MRDKRYINELVFLRERVTDWNEYPYNVPCIQKLTNIRFTSPVTFLFGDNGTGKTTILESIAMLCGLNIEGGSHRHSFSSTGRTSRLAEAMRYIGGGLTLSSGRAFFYRADMFAHFVRQIGSIDLVHVSRGEAFHSLVDHFFNRQGLYLLDEPEVALPPTQQLAFLRIIYDLARSGSQFIIVSHSPIIMAYPESVLYELSDQGIAAIEYESTDVYRTMHSFMLHRQSVLDELFIDDPA